MYKQSCTKPKVGKYILDTISIGMYNNPLMVIREYVQNSTDSIDEFQRNNGFYNEQPKIEIFIDGIARSLLIKDNGAGVPAKSASNALHNLGKSLKKVTLNRGFRGIGRLGGLGYCDELKFITKAKGESICSISKWNCKKLRSFISQDNESLDAAALIKEVVEFSQDKYQKNPKDHFFVVEMNSVRSSKDILLDVPTIKAYLSQVAPVPFDFNKFSFAKMIDKELRSKVPFYETYRIFVNEEQIFKPYKDEIRISQENVDHIGQIEFKEFQNGTSLLAFGWIADLQLLGVVTPSEHVDGIRLRSGNILIGDKNILSDFFRENRFNNYVIGEIHAVDNKLILNSRRDGFEDTPYKEEFYNSFVKEIGIPLSLKIREASKSRGELRKTDKLKRLMQECKDIAKYGYLSELHYRNVLREIKYLCNNLNDNYELENIDKLLTEINQASHCLDKMSSLNVRKHELKKIFDMIYKNCSNKVEGLEIIKKTMSYLGK